MRKTFLITALFGLCHFSTLAQRQIFLEEMPLPAEEQLALAPITAAEAVPVPLDFIPSLVTSDNVSVPAYRCLARGEQVHLSVDTRDGNPLQVMLKDRWGRVVQAERLVHPITERMLDLSGLPREAYMLELRGEQGQRFARFSVVLY